ncbi:MAG: hypothetical protein IKE91_08515 [Clostridia bacterium]|nr:hypothetical protein [Clostridia bacterium]
MSEFDVSNEANALYRQVKNLNKESQQYTELYNKLKNEVYNGTLKDLKQLTEKILNNVSSNYTGQNKKIFELAGQFNGNAQTMYQTLYTLLNKIYDKIEELNGDVKKLNKQIEDLKE